MSAFFSLFLVLAASAYAVAPSFVSISPAGGQRGTSVEVTLKGDRLADAQEIFLYGPGITVEKIADAKDKQVKAVLKIAADCRLGEHVLRLRTASGVSAMRVFFVGPFPNVAEEEPNNSAATAQAVSLDSTIEGVIAGEDIDTYEVEAKKGQRLSLEVEGARLGRTMFDPILTLKDSGGRLLATSDDTPLLGHDGFISLLAPADGKYVIQLRDVTYSGNAHAYRLHIGTFPRPAVMLPAGARPGETIEARFLGDPQGEFTQSITLPPAGEARAAVVAERDGVAPSPNWARSVDLPTVSAKPGNALAKAGVLGAAPPFALHGVLETKGEAAFYRFKARKNENLNVEVFARRLGSPLDSVVTVYGPKGALGSNDDAAGNPDSAVRVKIPEDGDYTLRVADQLARGGALYAYRVEITEVRPMLTLSIPDTARYDNETRKSIVVPRGNRFAVLMNINRDTCNDDLKLAFDGLPAGITAQAETIPGSLSAVPVVFEAAPDAPIAGNLLTPAARPVDDAKAASASSRFRHTVDWVRIQNDTVYVKSEVGQIAAAVVDEVPFHVRIVEPKVPLAQNGEMNLEVVAERAEGFEGPITVKMLWNPPGVSSQPDLTIAKGATTTNYKLSATNKAEVRNWKIAVVAGATVKGGTAYVSSQPAPLEIAPAFLLGKIDIAKVERGQKGKMTCVLDQKVPFEGAAVAKLVGLPGNVTAQEVEITKDTKQAVFEIVTSDKSPVGTHKNIFCHVVITRDGESITQNIATGSVLRIDAPRGKPAIAATGAGEKTVVTKN